MIKKYAILAILCVLANFLAIGQPTLDEEKAPSKAIIMSLDYGAMVNNYPALLMSIDYRPNSKWLYGVFVGPVTGSEITIIRSSNMKNNSGFKTGLESKRYLQSFGDEANTRVYFGLRYEYTGASFRSNYILKVNNLDDFYYQNVEDVFKVNMHSYIIKTGIVTNPSPSIYLEVGVGVGYFNKSMSPKPHDMGREVVKNTELVYDLSMSGFYYSLELKVGWLLFKTK